MRSVISVSINEYDDDDDDPQSTGYRLQRKGNALNAECRQGGKPTAGQTMERQTESCRTNLRILTEVDSYFYRAMLRRTRLCHSLSVLLSVCNVQ